MTKSRWPHRARAKWASPPTSPIDAGSMFDYLKKIPRKQIDLVLSALALLIAVGGAGLFTYYLFMQNEEAKIAIKGGSLGAAKGGGKEGSRSSGGGGSSSGSGSGGGSGAAEVSGDADDGEAAPPDPLADKTPAEQQAFTAQEAAERGDFVAALTYYRAALAADPENIACLQGAGEAALATGEYDQAEAFLRKGLASHRGAGGKPGDDRSAALANNLSRALVANGKAEEAEEVMAFSAAAQGKENPRYGESMASWAAAAAAAGKPDVAMNAARQGSAFFKKRGPLNPHYMRLLQITAKVATAQNDYVAATNAIKERLVVAERQHGRDSEEVAGLLTELAMLSYRQEKYGEAHEKLTEVLVIAQRLYPAGSALEAQTLRHLAMIEETLYPGQTAERRLREAYRIDRSIYGLIHGESARSAVLLARYLGGAGQYQEAESLFIDAISVWKDGGVDDLTAAGWLVAFGDLLDKMGKKKEAAEMRSLSNELGKRHQER